MAALCRDAATGLMTPGKDLKAAQAAAYAAVEKIHSTARTSATTLRRRHSKVRARQYMWLLP